MEEHLNCWYSAFGNGSIEFLDREDTGGFPSLLPFVHMSESLESGGVQGRNKWLCAGRIIVFSIIEYNATDEDQSQTSEQYQLQSWCACKQPRESQNCRVFLANAAVFVYIMTNSILKNRSFKKRITIIFDGTELKRNMLMNDRNGRTEDRLKELLIILFLSSLNLNLKDWQPCIWQS